MSGKGYIGKISAIVTVNTADATRAFNKSAADAQRYGAGLKRTIEQATRDAGKSFDNIFTPFQKLQRALQASRGANFNLGIDTKSIEQLALAARQLATPLAAATKQFDGLSFAAQRQFAPALTAVQTELLRIRDTLQEGGSVGQDVFRRLAGNVEQVTGSISRLNETATLTKKLLTLQDAQGLAFARPEVFDSINRLVEAQRGLSSLPAATRGSPAVRQLITDAQEAQAQINKITARIERLSSQGLDIRVSQAGLDAAVRRLDEIRQKTDAISQQQANARKAADNEIASLVRREQASKEIENQRAAAQQKAADNEIALLIRRQQNEKEVEKQRQEAAKKAADNEIAILIRREQGEKEIEKARQVAIKKAEDTELAILVRREQAEKQLEKQRQADAKKIEDNEIAILQRREQAEKQLEKQRQADAKKIEDNEIAALVRREQGEKEIEKQKQASAKKTADNEIALLIRREQAEKQIEKQKQASAQRAADNEIALLIRREQAAKQEERQRIDRQPVDVRDRLRNINAARQAAEEEAAFRARAADQAEREAAAVERIVQGQNKLLRAEADRRSGAGTRRNAAAFDAATEGILTAPRQERDVLIGRRQQTAESVRADIARLDDEFQRLPASAQAALQSSADELNAIADAVKSNSASLDVLIAKYNTVKDQVRSLATEEEQRQARLKDANSKLVVLPEAPRDPNFLPLGDLRKSAQDLKEIESQLLKVQAAARFGTTLDQSLESSRIDSYSAKLKLLQGILVSAGATSGDAAEEVNELASALQRVGSVRGGFLSADAVKGVNLQLAAAVAAVEKVAPGAAAAVKKVGDIGRGAFGNVGLAVQQAAFAFDDFFSVTGGLDQRLRAVGNNISQLGFVLGSTPGLVAGVAASITSQLVVALIKWSNQGVETQDNVRSLNESLSRQKGLVEDLAQAYQSVADAIERTGFSKRTQELRQQERLVDDIRKKQREELRERVAGLDPDVQRERAIQATRQRELEAANDPGERVRLTRAIRQSQDREREAADRAVSRPGATPNQAVQAAADARFRVREAEINLAARGAAANSPSAAAQQRIEQQRVRDIEEARRQSEQFRQQNEAVVNGTRDPREQVRRANEVLDRQQREIEQSITTGIAALFDGANAERRRQLVALEQARSQLEKDIFRVATNEVAIEATKTAIEAASRIGRAQELLANALEGGASEVGDALDRANQALLDAEAQLKTASASGNLPQAEAARELINQINAEIRARESAAASVAQFADVLKRISTSLAETVASEARSTADQSRRDANAGAAGVRLGRNRPEDQAFLDRRRERAERQAREAEERRDRVARQNDLRRRLFEREAAGGQLGEDLRRATRERDDAQRFLDLGRGSADDRANATVRRDRAQATLDRGFEDSPSGRAAANAADRADRDAQMARQQEESVSRGRDLMRSPAQKAADQIEQDVFDISSAFDEAAQAIIDGGNGLIGDDARKSIDQLRGQTNEAISRSFSEAARSAAPAIFDLADQVQNAILQGPSRAALNAQDVSTPEGASELSRLLRGDDPSRNVNLVELQKQNQALVKIEGVLTKIEEKIGMTIDIK